MAKKTTTSAKTRPATKATQSPTNNSKGVKIVSDIKINTPKMVESKDSAIIKTNKPVKFWTAKTIQRTSLFVFSAVIIALVFVFNLYFIPEKILTQTDAEVAKINEQKSKDAKDKEIKNNQEKISSEGKILNFEQNKEFQVGFKLNNYDEIKISLKTDWAPKTVENFIRLAYRNVYEGVAIHRIVKTDNFSVIQGGDTDNANGQGGKSAFYISSDNKQEIPDELWSVAPEFGTTVDTQGKLLNDPKFRAPDLYSNFSKDTGQVEYRKGLILMAKTSQPNSATSQFFVTLDKTILPAQYTVFGVVDSSSFATLDKIRNEINPTADKAQTSSSASDQPVTDGKPDKNLYTEKVSILSPKF